MKEIRKDLLKTGLGPGEACLTGTGGCSATYWLKTGTILKEKKTGTVFFLFVSKTGTVHMQMNCFLAESDRSVNEKVGQANKFSPTTIVER